VGERTAPPATCRISVFTVTPIFLRSDNGTMPILLIVLIVLILLSYGGGMSRPQYRTHGISVGTILLIILILWLLGVFGSRPF
jgi:hypothetical protein